MTISPRRWALDLTAVALVACITLIGWAPTFTGPAYLAAGLGALVLGLGIAALGARFRLGVLSLAGLTVGAYFLVGGALALPSTTIAGVVPTLETLRLLAVRAVTGWKSLLTSVTPVALADGHAIVVLIVTLVGTVVSASLALRLARAAWALIPLGAMLAVEIAMGTFEESFPLLQGIALVVIVIAWLALREAWAPAHNAVSVAGGSDASRGAGRRRLAAGGVVLVLAAGVGVAANAVVPGNLTRDVIREYITPPFDIHEYASPLQSYRLYVRDFKDEALFTVAGGLPGDVRIRLGVMDAYNGIVYDVAEDSSSFDHLRTDMAPDATGDDVALDITIDAYSDVWLPDAGTVDRIEFAGERGEELRRSAYYNSDTGAALAQAGLREGDAYTVHAVNAAVPKDSTLADAEFADVALPEIGTVPEGVAAFAADTIAEAETPIERVRAIESQLSEYGFFSHGLEGEAYSLPGHGARRMQTLFENEQMVGDDEQYAVAMALMAREVGIPARVVMGFHDQIVAPGEEPPAAGEDFVATGDNLHAWVEVAFEGYGWLPFDPTPPEDQEPQQETTQPKPDPKPQVVQPPSPPQEPADLPPLIPDEEEQEDEADPGWGVFWLVLTIAGIGFGSLLILIAPFALIALLKGAKRRRRLRAEQPADRIAGGWEELMDRATDYGVRAPVGRTRQEEAALVGGALEEPRVGQLAVRADASVFGPGDPGRAEIADYWKQVDEVVDEMAGKASFWKRMKARISIASLTQGSKLSMWARSLRERAAASRREDVR
ncbi:transglutaminase-like domain-containing protein [Microbacterium halophytorum]|uniref:transglutaminase-like domain-containing protein n=1 Tax=Microbacterium halophytorum TaxID=2067568 RepID=UPI000CFB8EA9|nr:transglutaminase-like domain-containing protein [Microbacterium halophytorum]